MEDRTINKMYNVDGVCVAGGSSDTAGLAFRPVINFTANDFFHDDFAENLLSRNFLKVKYTGGFMNVLQDTRIKLSSSDLSSCTVELAKTPH